MTDETYNGWKNYPTWCVHLWLTSEPLAYDYWITAAEAWSKTETPRVGLADQLKDEVRRAAETDEASYRADLLGYALDCVDWYEIADAFLEVALEPA